MVTKENKSNKPTSFSSTRSKSVVYLSGEFFSLVFKTITRVDDFLDAADGLAGSSAVV